MFKKGRELTKDLTRPGQAHIVALEFEPLTFSTAGKNRNLRSPYRSKIRFYKGNTKEYNGSHNQIGSKSTPSEPSPVFVSVESVVRVAPSHMAILPCSVVDLGDRQVVWRRVKEDEFLTIGKMVWSKDPRILVEYRVQENGVTSWDLLLRNVQYNDAGVYECQVTSSEIIVWNVELKVIDPVTTKPKSRVHKQVTQAPRATDTMETADHQRPRWQKQFLMTDHERSPQKEEFVTAGQPVRLICNTSLVNQSLPRTTNIEWYKNGEIIESNPQVLLTRYQLEVEQMYISELMIDKSKLADSGNYLCRFMDIDLLLVRVSVLPNTTINSANKEDQSPYYAVDNLQKASSAVPSYRVSCSWSIVVLYLIHALFVINQLSVLTYEYSTSSLVQMSSYFIPADPT